MNAFVSKIINCFASILVTLIMPTLVLADMGLDISDMGLDISMAVRHHIEENTLANTDSSKIQVTEYYLRKLIEKEKNYELRLALEKYKERQNDPQNLKRTLWDLTSYAMMDDNYGAVGILIESGADVNYQESEDSSTLLDIAFKEDALFSARTLLKNGADPNLTSRGKTTLFEAVRKENEPFIKLLLAHGADPFAKFNEVFLDKSWLSRTQIEVYEEIVGANDGMIHMSAYQEAQITKAYAERDIKSDRAHFTIACLSKAYETSRTTIGAGIACRSLSKSKSTGFEDSLERAERILDLLADETWTPRWILEW
ncbi:MAG: ankyrin repeat domain-containing protein [Bdellovibrionales bacterium]|nr:ankyrin repeat domain-containing protein [Bdellovibrionales bacterium]